MVRVDLDFFEKIVIQQCLKKDTTYVASIIEYLDKSLFKNSHIALLVDLIKTFYVERGFLPSLTEIKVRASTENLKEALRKVVSDLKGLDKEYNADELISNTEYFIKQRSYGLLTEKIIDHKAANKEFDLDDIQRESESIHSISLIDNLGLDYFGENDRVVEYLQQKDSLISTGYRSLDDAFGGGFQAEGKAIYDIGGETNVGKSIFLANIALNIILQNKNVLIISPEMSEMRYAKRISGMLTNIAIATLGENIERYKKDVAAFKKKFTSKLIIKEVPTKGVSAKNIYAYTKKLKDKKGFEPSLMAIDGHGLLKPSVPQTNKHTELQYITQECRGITYLINAPILTVAQLNRGSHKMNNPGLDNLAGSWDQIADFDGHVNIWQTDEDREADIIRFGGKKVRDGAKGAESYLRINYDTLRLYEEENAPDTRDFVQEKDLSKILDFDSLMATD